jgi:hypothetical protein
MNIFSILAPDDTSSRRSSISSVSSQNKDNKIQRDSSSSMGMGIPSIRNVFSMDDGSINRSEERGGETSNSLSQFHPFVRNVFSMNDISMEEGEEERNPSFLSSMRDVEKDNSSSSSSSSSGGHHLMLVEVSNQHIKSWSLELMKSKNITLNQSSMFLFLLFLGLSLEYIWREYLVMTAKTRTLTIF